MTKVVRGQDPTAAVEDDRGTNVVRRSVPTAVVEDGRERTGAADRRHHDSDRPVGADQVAERAYELHLDRGGQHGADLDDWLQAERELENAASARGRTGE